MAMVIRSDDPFTLLSLPLLFAPLFSPLLLFSFTHLNDGDVEVTERTHAHRDVFAEPCDASGRTRRACLEIRVRPAERSRAERVGEGAKR